MAERDNQSYLNSINRNPQARRTSPEMELKRMILPLHTLIKTILTDGELSEKISPSAVIQLALMITDPDGSISSHNSTKLDEQYVKLTHIYFVLDLLQVSVISMHDNRGYLVDEDYHSLGDLLDYFLPQVSDRRTFYYFNKLDAQKLQQIIESTLRELKEANFERNFMTTDLHTRNKISTRYATLLAESMKNRQSPKVEQFQNKLTKCFDVSSISNEGFRQDVSRGSSLLRNSLRITTIKKSA